MDEDLQSRLRRLGVVRGTRNLKHTPKGPIEPGSDPLPAEDYSALLGEDYSDSQPLEKLLPGGRLMKNRLGACFVLDTVYPIQFQHGADRLIDLTSSPLGMSAVVTGDDRLSTAQHLDFVFLDTETTGLAGAGTLAFMVGIGFFEKNASNNRSEPDLADNEAFIVRQYFLRDHGDEPAMLMFLAELLSERSGLITFNGRSFDLPLLYNRFIMNRLDDLAGDLLDRPHIDLLPPSRRLWRRRVGSCSLGSLENNVLGIRRTGEDVPGWAIPGLYMDFLRSGDARPLLGVFYHNQIDMLSMVTLTSRLLRQFSQPAADDPAEDLLSLAVWQSTIGLLAESEQNFREVTLMDVSLDLFHRSQHYLGALLKKDGRREEAVQVWQQIAYTYTGDVDSYVLAIDAHVELAKFYEWHQVDLNEAHLWTRRAIIIVDDQGYGRHDPSRQALIHRLKRLERKLEIIGSDGPNEV